MRFFAAAALTLCLCACGRYSEPRMFEDSLRSVPDVVQQTAADANAELEAEGFLVRLQSNNRPTEESLAVERCPNAKVVRSEPFAKEKVVKATTVTIVVARC